MKIVLQEKFEIPRGCDVWILQSIGKKWRSWKADVKSRYYDPKISTELQLCNVPKRILKDQWKNLLSYWNSEESKCISERNKKTRSKKSLMHKTGKRSFGQVREDQEKSIGHSPTRVEMFEKCYTKEGITNSIDACEALEKMKEIQSQTSQTEDFGRDDIFSKVLGNDKVGRVRMYGLGVTPYVAWGEIPNRSNTYRLIEGYKEAFEKMEKQMQEQGEVIVKMKLDMQSTQQATNNTPLRAAQHSQNGHVHSFNNSTLIQVAIYYLSDRMTPTDADVCILNNQLSSFMWIDKKEIRFERWDLSLPYSHGSLKRVPKTMDSYFCNVMKHMIQ